MVKELNRHKWLLNLGCKEKKPSTVYPDPSPQRMCDICSALELEPKLTMATIQDLSQTELVPFLSESLKWKSMRKDF